MQLKHNEKEESRENHGYVSIQDSNGKELARSEDVQHNRNYQSRVKLIEELGRKAITAVSAAA